MKQARAKRQPSVEEHRAGPATDEDTPQVSIDIDKAREDMMRDLVLNDDPPEESGSTAAADRYILSFFIKEGER